MGRSTCSEKSTFIGVGQKSEVNFQARYVNGNRGQKGIKNLHLNIRSLGNKITEVKNIIREHNLTFLGYLSVNSERLVINLMKAN